RLDFLDVALVLGSDKTSKDLVKPVLDLHQVPAEVPSRAGTKSVPRPIGAGAIPAARAYKWSGKRINSILYLAACVARKAHCNRP
ncbi:MAG TPA: hypothetical protein VEH50_14790, partial [Methylomirabilota bacterium]|nr:hypothetical protein [Methylomirabilota bacterium]